MGQRNMLFNSQMMDLQMDQQAPSRTFPEPTVIPMGVPNFLQPNVPAMLPATGTPANFDTRRPLDSHENAILYGMAPYNAFQHHHPARDLDFGVPVASNYYNPYMTPGCRMIPLPINQVFHDQLPSQSNCGIIGVPADDYRRNSYIMDGVRGSFKRKTAEGIPGSFQYCNASVGSSSAVYPMSVRPDPGVSMVDASSFPLPEYRGNDIPAVMEVGSHRSARRSAIQPDTMLSHNPNQSIRANFPGHPFQTASSPWLGQHFSSGSGGGTLTWSQAPAATFLHGSVNAGLPDTGSMGAQGYQEAARNRSSATLLQHPPIHQGQPNLYHLPQPMLGVRGQNINFIMPIGTSSHRLPTNSTSQNIMNPFPDAVGVGPRYLAAVPPTGLGVYHPLQRAVMPEATEVAMLEIPGYYEVGNSIDHHRDMRLDIDHMSYEELLALGERIGNVVTGLSEETILSHLKTRMHIPPATTLNLEEPASVDLETDFCAICQTDYEKEDEIGTLDCGHEYHVDCVKRWLLIKNTCPVCKSSGLIREREEELGKEG
ncbi:probable E3 ubiquitin-protein ligase ZFP1 isoform X2 [Diospyros lotus]|uniref:probable E3 ubiquitin-protein ligase ZFP1 isoform X2 n=1 Tax=Diospyros lotus TaxID=55363 RepID=UPI00224E146B|nr:probable E3 ubiquitin-protein ligase ZFP1 isoform X2 [Diospyros lotus]